ncbi:adhesion G protein-coupled receptor A3 [Cloeon dipterum]|uniref:adhesion G protein-coupled receptor A3 n=1 Tax=Cloeon dipterum TaxID=197152 RepID=UPI00321FC61C
MNWALPLLLGLWAAHGWAQEKIAPCPNLCRCNPARSSNKTSSQSQSGVKLRCGDTHKVNVINELDPASFPKNVVHLDLSGNLLIDIGKPAFAFLPQLQKLDLKDNSIRFLAQEAFSGLSNLKRLDLSGNKLQELSGSVFQGLEKLVTLKLNNNELDRIAEGAFDDLISLKTLDLSSNPLVCDCHMDWLVNWIRNESVEVTSGSVCGYPLDLQGEELSKVSGLICRHPSQVSLEILPDTDQLVFQGDSLHMVCLLVGPPRETRVFWARDGLAVTEVTPQTRFQPKEGTTVSSLIIENLEMRHSGTWRCSSGNLSQSLAITVLTTSAKLCSAETTEDLRGRYNWQQTLTGTIAQAPCPSLQDARASRPCLSGGLWGSWDSILCPYLSNVTRGLQQFALMSPANQNDANNTLSGLLKFTGNLSLLRSAQDLVFVATTLANHLSMLDPHNIAPLILRTMAQATMLPKDLLQQAQLQDQSCTKMLGVIEAVAEQTAQSLDVLAVQSFKVYRSNFNGLWCIWFQQGSGTRRLKCDFKPLGMVEEEVIAVIQIPYTLFRHASLRSGNQAQLIVVVMESPALFPDNNTITSPVIGCKLVGESLLTPLSSEYVWVTLKSPIDSMPVTWVDGRWSEAGCNVSHLLEPLLLFHCNSLGYFATRQVAAMVQSTELPALPSRFSDAFAYASCLVLGVCLVVAVITYVASPLSMPAATKHSLVNTWVAFLLLSLTFSCGIYLTGDPLVCNSIGLLIHYFSMSCLLWKTVTVSDLHKRLTAHESIPDEDEEEEGPVAGGKSLLGIYMVGWGVSAMVCGVSAAVHRYTTPEYCFLPPPSTVFAALVPAIIVLIVYGIFWLMAYCATIRRAHDPVPSSASSSASIDQERTPESQLLANLVILLLFLAAWATAAASVATEDWFSQVLSGSHFIICVSMGTTILLYFCAGRSDVTAEWKAFTDPRQWISRTSENCHGQAVADMEMTADQITITDHTTVTVIEKSEVQTEEEPEDQAGLLRKINSMRSEIPLATSTVVSEDAFYDPRQLGVARKFFRRQRLRQNSDAESLFSGNSKINNTNIHHPKLNNRINLHPNMMNVELSVHKNVFEPARAQSPMSSISEARNYKSRYLSRAHSADNLEQEKRRRHRTRRKRRRKTEEVGNESDQSKQETCV